MRSLFFVSALVFRVVEFYLPVVKLGSDVKLRAAYKFAFPLSDTAVQGFKSSSAFRRGYLNLPLTKKYTKKCKASLNMSIACTMN